MNTTQELKFKISTPSGEFRRLRFASAPTWSEFLDYIENVVLPGVKRESFSVQYVDEEGDKVSIGSQQEWKEGLDVIAETNKQNQPQVLLKLFLVSKQQPSSTSSAPQAQIPPFNLKSILESFLASGALESFQNQPQSCEALKTLLDQVLQPQRLEPLFAQLPTLLSALNNNNNNNINTNDNNNTHAEFRRHCRGGPRNFDSCRRSGTHHGHHGQRRHFWSHRLHRTGYQFLIEKNFVAAKECYEELVRLAPEDNIALYNLACAYSLLSASLVEGQQQEMQQKAIDAVSKAVACGYADAAHMEADVDFDPIRNRQEFIDLLASMKNQQQQPQPQPESNLETPVQQQQQPQPESKQEDLQPIQVEEKLQPTVTVPPTTNNDHANQEENFENQHSWLCGRKEAERSEFENELKQLEEMGFNDRERNLALLRRKRGNLGRVLARLLD